MNNKKLTEAKELVREGKTSEAHKLINEEHGIMFQITKETQFLRDFIQELDIYSKYLNQAMNYASVPNKALEELDFALKAYEKVRKHLGEFDKETRRIHNNIKHL